MKARGPAPWFSALVGREDSSVFGSDQREERRWIGKPWRRIELLTNRYFHKGEEIDRSRDLSLHIGFRRLGFGFTLAFVRQSYLDYSDETQ